MSEDTFDPSAPEGASPAKSQYISKKDLRVLVVAFAVLLIVLIPVFQWGKRNSEKSICIKNLSAIYKAMEFYAIDKDDRLPVAYYTLDWEHPVETDSGRPRTWASDIAPYMTNRASFACPAAAGGEAAVVDGNSSWNQGKPISLTYGMYAAYSSALRSTFENPDAVVLIAETANHGAGGTFDPKPLDPSDAYVVGWDNSNVAPDAETSYVTRLTFAGTQGGTFQESAAGRHDIGIHTITAVGARLNLKADRAKVQISRSTNLPEGTWATPPGLRRLKGGGLRR